MNREYSRKAPLVCFVFAAFALVITASIGGLIELLATEYATSPHTTVKAAAPQVAAIGSHS